MKIDVFPKYIVLFMLIVHATTAVAQYFGYYDYRGTGYSLDHPADPRSIALGESFVAAPNNSAAMMYNPAGLPSTGGISLWYAQRNETIYGIEGRKYFSFNVACHTPFADAGFFYNRFNYGDISFTTEQSPDGTGQTVNLFDRSYGFSIAKRLGEFGAGFSIKTLDISGMFNYFNSTFTTTVTRPLLVDFGVLYSHDFSINGKRPIQQFNVGLSIQNLGEDIKVTDKPNGVLQPGTYSRINNTIKPRQYLRIGCAFTTETGTESPTELSAFHFMLTCEYRNWVNGESNSNRGIWGFGMEGIVYEIVAFRVGGFDDNKLVLLRYGGGVSLPFKVFAVDMPLSLKFDYAAIKLPHYVDDGSTLHSFSLGIQYEDEFL
jgi:hypothetical protein